MKKLLISTAVTIFLFGCATGNISFQKDDFKDATIESMDLNHSSDEMGMGFAYADAHYVREFTTKKVIPTVIHFKFTRANFSSDIEKKAFIKVDEKKYDINLTDLSGEVHTTLETEKTTTYNVDQSGFVDFTKGNTAVTGVSANSKKVYSAKLSLTEDMENNILKSAKIMIRVYFGTEPTTFTIAQNDLEKIKSFIKAKPGDDKK
jgi:hypothetical protein